MFMEGLTLASERDKGAVQHADANSNRTDKGAVEASVTAAAGTILPQIMQLAS